MKKLMLGLVVLALLSSCTKDNTATDPHVANANCGSCHPTELSQWESSANLHAASAADVLVNAEHNTAELLTDDCLKCHASFQYSLGVAHFVTPVNQVGSPADTWTALNTSEWKATKCEVCHNPIATNTAKLAKYGSLLDGDWSAGYIEISALPEAYQKIIDLSTGVITTYTYPNQSDITAQTTKLCLSCHDPADQGGDPEVIEGGISLGPQGGDSRSYIASNHQGFGCVDCHNPHDFTPVNPQTTSACSTCHTSSKTGKVHTNHWL